MGNGQVAVLESNPPEVRLYDPAGRHIKSFGRRGRRYKAALDTATQWLSLTIDGRLLAVIDMPANARVLDFTADRVLLTERDADDLEYVAAYRLVAKKP